jgi:6-phosphogluconolactonase
VAEFSGALTVLKVDPAHGTLSEIQSYIMKSKSFDENKKQLALNPFHTGEVALHPSGRFLYCSNRGPDTVAVFRVDPVKGTVTPIEEVSSRGVMPRTLALDPTGEYLFAANQASDDITTFRIDTETGRLAATRRVIKVDSPSCVVFTPVQ